MTLYTQLIPKLYCLTNSHASGVCIQSTRYVISCTEDLQMETTHQAVSSCIFQTHSSCALSQVVLKWLACFFALTSSPGPHVLLPSLPSFPHESLQESSDEYHFSYQVFLITQTLSGATTSHTGVSVRINITHITQQAAECNEHFLRAYFIPYQRLHLHRFF